jgi:hypothetical protein
MLIAKRLNKNEKELEFGNIRSKEPVSKDKLAA